MDQNQAWKLEITGWKLSFTSSKKLSKTKNFWYYFFECKELYY